MKFFCFRVCRSDDSGVVLSGLLLGPSLPGGHNISLSYGIPGGRRAADRRRKASDALHEQHDLLHRLPVPAAPRRFVLIYRI